MFMFMITINLQLPSFVFSTFTPIFRRPVRGLPVYAMSSSLLLFVIMLLCRGALA